MFSFQNVFEDEFKKVRVKFNEIAEEIFDKMCFIDKEYMNKYMNKDALLNDVRDSFYKKFHDKYSGDFKCIPDIHIKPIFDIIKNIDNHNYQNDIGEIFNGKNKMFCYIQDILYNVIINDINGIGQYDVGSGESAGHVVVDTIEWRDPGNLDALNLCFCRVIVTIYDNTYIKCTKLVLEPYIIPNLANIVKEYLY